MPGPLIGERRPISWRLAIVAALVVLFLPITPTTAVAGLPESR